MTKKLFCTLLCVLLLALTVTPVFAEESYNGHNTYGDIGNNKKLDAWDYMALKRYVLGTYELWQKAWYRADVNFDGDVDAKDYMLIKRLVLGTAKAPEYKSPHREMTDAELYGAINRELGYDRDEGVLEICILEDAVGTLEQYGLTEGKGVGTYGLGSVMERDGVRFYYGSVRCEESEIRELFFRLVRDENIIDVSVVHWLYPA